MAEPNDPNYRMGVAAPEDPTMRQSVQQAIANFLLDTGLVSDNYRAQRTGEAIVGTTREDAPAMGIGLTDFTPGGLAFIPEDVGEQVDKGNYVTAGIVGGLSALEAYPLTKAIAKPAKNFLMDLAGKAAPKTVPFDQTRRDLMQGSLAAGALSTLPVVQQVAKVMDEVPPAFHEGRHRSAVVNKVIAGLDDFIPGDGEFLGKLLKSDGILDRLDDATYDVLQQQDSGTATGFLMNNYPDLADNMRNSIGGSDGGKYLNDYFEGKINLEDLPEIDQKIVKDIQEDLLEQGVEDVSPEAVKQARQKYLEELDDYVNDEGYLEYYEDIRNEIDEMY
jgi:hypothetical protein